MLVTIFTGSTLGSTEYISEHLEEVLNSQDIATNLIHQPSFSDLQDGLTLLIVTATHGAGDLPDSLMSLFDDLEESEIDLSNLKFAVVGIGSSDYDTFCVAADTVTDALLARGGKQICEGIKIDVANIEQTPEDIAEAWLKNFTNAL